MIGSADVRGGISCDVIKYFPHNIWQFKRYGIMTEILFYLPINERQGAGVSFCLGVNVWPSDCGIFVGLVCCLLHWLIYF